MLRGETASADWTGVVALGQKQSVSFGLCSGRSLRLAPMTSMRTEQTLSENENRLLARGNYL